ncbi:MAG: hypothetical protein JHC26_05615 [Thermofilum sp.]|jgi:hypothetical protein|uniref:hypothetical protein n=1 Tax=Thermofilum sp. TaxID=1961369 RepID=UPI002583DADF|nr:hypothetical protein [Thermofilum sp.]MCI4408549.1 hypothetical protein [Thermofilum sp.]
MSGEEGLGDVAFTPNIVNMMPLYINTGGNVLKMTDKRSHIEYLKQMVRNFKAGDLKQLGFIIYFLSMMASNYNPENVSFSPVPAPAIVEDVDVIDVDPKTGVKTVNDAEEFLVIFRCRYDKFRFDIVWRLIYFPSVDRVVVEPDLVTAIKMVYGDKEKIPSKAPNQFPLPPVVVNRRRRQPISPKELQNEETEEEEEEESPVEEEELEAPLP